MGRDLKDFWDEAEATGEPVKLGNSVFCDVCSKEWTGDPTPGGFIFGSNAYCPDCADEAMKNIIGYGEEHFIRAMCPKDQPFAAFVIAYRGGDAAIQMYTMPKTQHHPEDNSKQVMEEGDERCGQE